MMITADLEECQQIMPRILSFSTCFTEEKTQSTKTGKVVIMICSLRLTNEEPNWDNSIRTLAKKCKPNILKGYDHHGSSGECYAFGNKPHYGMVEKVSVSVFVNKTSKVKKLATQIQTDADHIEHMRSKRIAIAVENLSKYIPEIRSLTSPIIDSVVSIQKKSKTSVLTNVRTTESGFWNTMLYYNGTTSKLHTEKYCAYTMITFLKQMGSASRKHTNKPMFLFKLNNKNKLMTPIASSVDLYIVDSTLLMGNHV